MGLAERKLRETRDPEVVSLCKGVFALLGERRGRDRAAYMREWRRKAAERAKKAEDDRLRELWAQRVKQGE